METLYHKMAFAMLWCTYFPLTCAVNYESLKLLQSKIDHIFQLKGSNCITTISSKSYPDFLPSHLPAIQFSLEHDVGIDGSLLSASLELCPFLSAGFFTNETMAGLMKILTNHTLPQKVLLALYLENIDLVLLGNDFFSTHPNVVFITPASTDGSSQILWRPRAHPHFTVDQVAWWDGMEIVAMLESTKNKEGDLLFAPMDLNLYGDSLTASAVIYAPFYIPGGGENGDDAGIEVELVETIVQSMEGKVKIAPPTDGGIWGNDLDGDGIFSGMVGDIQAKRVDLGFSQLFVKHERLAFMDFTVQYDYDYNCFLVKKPPPLTQVFALIRPFDLPTWSLIGCTMVVAIAFLLLASNIQTLFNAVEGDNKLTFNTGTSVMFIFSLAMMESHNYTFCSAQTSMRASICSVLLGFFIVSRAYSSGLVAFLSVHLSQQPIDSLEDISQSGIPSASLFGSDYIQGSRSANEHVLSLARTHREFQDLDIGFTNFSQGEIILYQSRQFLQNEIRSRLTDGYGETSAHIVSECPESFHVALGLTKHSPYTAPFNHRIRQLSEAGFIIKWTRDYMEQAGHLSAQSGSPTASVEPLMLDELVGPFQVFAGLLLACVATLFCELLTGVLPIRRQKQSRQQRNAFKISFKNIHKLYFE